MIRRTLLAVAVALTPAAAARADLVASVASIRHTVVGIGAYDRRADPPGKLAGTGFFVHDGRLVATSYHVLAPDGRPPSGQDVSIFIPRGADAEIRPARLAIKDARHDLALLRIEGPPGRSLAVPAEASRAEGTAVAITGFPIASALGLFPMTNAGIIASVSPIATPQSDPRTLTAQRVRLLRAPFEVLVLDMIAYPGNSGSPVYAAEDGALLGVVSGVYIRRSREALLSDPSAITYAIPVRHLAALLARLNKANP